MIRTFLQIAAAELRGTLNATIEETSYLVLSSGSLSAVFFSRARAASGGNYAVRFANPLRYRIGLSPSEKKKGVVYDKSNAKFVTTARDNFDPRFHAQQTRQAHRSRR